MPTIKFTFKSTGGSAVKKEIEEIARLLQQINTSQTGGVAEQFDRLGGAARKIKSEVDAADQSIRNIAAGTQILQQALSLATGAIAGGVQDFAAFDTAIRTAGVTSQSSAEELGVLREEVSRLGQVSSKTPEEVARTSIELTRAGFSAAETADALEGVVRASEATGTSLTTVGDVVAKTIRQFGLAASDSGQVADVLVQAANTANVSVTSLGESLKFAGVAGNAANQDLETTVAALAALGDVGLQGGIGGRNLTSAFSSLQQVSAATSTEIEGLKTASDSAIAAFETLAVNFRDSNGEIRDLFEILPELRTELEGLNQADQDAVVQAIFGTQGSRAVFALLGKTDEELQNFRQSLRDSAGTAVESGEAVNAGLGGSLLLLESAIAVASNAFIAQLAPAIQFAIDGLASIVNAFVALPGPVQSVIAGISALGFAYTGLVVAINQNLIAQVALLATQVRAAFVNAQDVINKGAQTAATLALSAAQKVLAVSTLGAAAALKTALGAALAFAAVGVAIALVAKRFNDVNGAIQGARDSLEGYRDATDNLLKIQEELAQTEEERSDAAQSRVEANIQAIEDEISVVDRLVDAVGKAAEVLLNISTLGLAGLKSESTFDLRLNAQSRGFEEVREDVDQFISDIERTPAAELEALDPAEIEAQVARLDELKTALEAQKPVTEAAAIAQRVYLQSLEQTRERLVSVNPALEQTGEATDALTEQVQVQTDAIDRRNEALAQAAQDQFDLQQEDRDFAQDDANEQRQRAFQAELQANEEAFQAAQDAQRLQLQARQQAATSEFEDQLEQRQSEFQTRQQQDRAAFEESLNERRRFLEEELQAFREQGEEELSQLQQEADLQVQLQLIDDPVERARVEAEERARIEAEAQEQRIREQVEAQLGLTQQREDFELELARRQQAIEAELQAGEAQFQLSQQLQQETFEEGLQQERLAFEQQLATEREVLEARLRAEDEIYQAQKLAQEDQFARDQREIDRQYRLEQRELERAFKEQQRVADLTNAERVKEILESANIQIGAGSSLGASIPGLRVGGEASAGQLYQLHKDEYVIPSRDAMVISQALSRKIDSRAGSLPELLRSALSTPKVSVATGGDRLGKIEKLLGSINNKLGKGVNRSVAVNNYRSVQGMGLRDVNAIARALG